MDEVLAYASTIEGLSSTYFVHSNHLYSPAALTNSAGSVVERYKYDAYGKQTIMAADGQERTEKISNYAFDRGFTGYVADSETVLMYARARMYSPVIGRFISRDPWTLIPSSVSVKVYYTGAGSDEKDKFQPKQWRSSQPVAGDGYRDGSSLYAGYFAPNQLDPSGEVCERRTWKSDPTAPHGSNGCGSGPTANVVPDSWPFFNGINATWVSFTPACDAHDICYSNCGADKHDCDTALEAGILVACHQAVQLSDLWEWQKKMVILQCQGVAAGYRYAVQKMGKDPYEQAQDRACLWECFDCKHCGNYGGAGVRIRGCP